MSTIRERDAAAFVDPTRVPIMAFHDRRALMTAGDALAEAAGPEPAENQPDCTCDRDDDMHAGEPIVLCPMHEKFLRPLSWDTLASIVVDCGAAFHRIDAALAAWKAATG